MKLVVKVGVGNGIAIEASFDMVISKMGVSSSLDFCPCSDLFPNIGQAGGCTLDVSLYVNGTVMTDILKASVDIRTFEWLCNLVY